MDFDAFDPLYDEKVADDGRWFTVTGDNGKYYGEFKLRYVDEFSDRGALEFEKLRKKSSHKVAAMGTWDKIAFYMCELRVVDWKGIKSNGKEVKFTKELAFKFFSLEQHRHILWKVNEFSLNPAHFEADDEASVKN